MAKFKMFVSLVATATSLALATPAMAELVNATKPQTLEAIVKSKDMPAKLITKDGESPYIESEHNGLKYLILFMNCDDSKQNCKTIQYYMGFSDAKDTTLERFNQWNAEKRFARAYRDKEGDPVLEMDLDLDFAGIPRESVVESIATWTSLMDSFQAHVFKKDE